jgi:hypothetical protein
MTEGGGPGGARRHGNRIDHQDTNRRSERLGDGPPGLRRDASEAPPILAPPLSAGSGMCKGPRRPAGRGVDAAR